MASVLSLIIRPQFFSCALLWAHGGVWLTSEEGVLGVAGVAGLRGARRVGDLNTIMARYERCQPHRLGVGCVPGALFSVLGFSVCLSFYQNLPEAL